MRRRTFLTTATAAAGLGSLAPALLTPMTASAQTSDTRAIPRVLTETATATGAPVHPERRFDLVAVSRAPEHTSDARVRFELPDGWGSWRDLHFHTDGPDHLDPNSTAMVRAPEGATGYQVRGTDGADLTAMNVRDGERLTFGGPAHTTLSAEGDEYRSMSGTSLSPLRTRAGWGADESLRFDENGDDLWPAEFHRVQALTVHHTAMETTDDHAADVRAVYRLHAAEQGWGDIGYHLLIDPDGVVYEGRHSGGDGVPIFSGTPLPGRARSVTAGHAGGFNHANIGVCLLGDFTEEVPTRAAQDALVVVLRVLCALTGVNPAREIEYENPDTGALTPQEAVSRHRDWSATECPGNAFADVFDSAIRERVVRGRT